ncbi:hypothetical protein GCM10023084_20700 [Streptomyces lacrimifluminis]|uniref:Uncharacterized protein n=1 Tax=Streptomyces lacrimifluminis TaxID=1500077 RepID=A0A917NW74_9ACTN|nr:hypothetical protein [Streptomyces lacrimifluminis]GGJ35199.1 hypothetical protein GCM10012282_34910 [Streptomyces lacrimifluminis]
MSFGVQNISVNGVGFKNRRRLSFFGSLLSVSVLSVTGCSFPGGSEARSVRPASSSPAASPEWRALTQAELENARLNEGEIAGYRITHGGETLADLEKLPIDASPAECVPLAEMIFRARGERATGYSPSNVTEKRDFADTMSVILSSYPPGEAERAFSGMDKSLSECRSMGFRSRYGDSARVKISTGAVTEAGDEAVHVRMSRSADEIDSYDSYVLVRTGPVIAYFHSHGSMGSSLSEQQKKRFMPVVKEDLISRQVAKVEVALRTGSAV